MEHMNKLFDCIRLIDVDCKSLRQEYYIHSCVDYLSKFDYIQRKDIYERCLELDSAIYRIKQEGNNLLIYVVFPTYIEKKKLVMECIVNITEKLDMNQCCMLSDSVYKLTITDDLTDIYNRRYINQALPLAISKCSKNEVPLSLIFTDLDSFKAVNDLYGHEAGDYLLREFAAELQNNIRQNTDWVARYGGDEFLLCLVGVNNLRAQVIAERIRKIVEQKSFTYHEHRIKTTCSLGVYTVNSFQVLPTYDSLLREVDMRLYDAKKAGRNKVK